MLNILSICSNAKFCILFLHKGSYKIKLPKCNSVGKDRNSDRKSKERGKIDTCSTQRRNRPLFRLGTALQLKSGGVKLVLSATT